MDRVRTTEPLTPLAYRPKDAATMLGISKSMIYQLIADGHSQLASSGNDGYPPLRPGSSP